MLFTGGQIQKLSWLKMLGMSWVNNSQNAAALVFKNPRFQIKSCTEFVKESIFLFGNIKVIDCTCLHHLRKNDICLHIFFYANNIEEYFFTFVVIKKSSYLYYVNRIKIWIWQITATSVIMKM